MINSISRLMLITLFTRLGNDICMQTCKYLQVFLLIQNITFIIYMYVCIGYICKILYWIKVKIQNGPANQNKIIFRFLKFLGHPMHYFILFIHLFELLPLYKVKDQSNITYKNRVGKGEMDKRWPFDLTARYFIIP